MHTNDPSYEDDTAQADDLFDEYLEMYGYNLDSAAAVELSEDQTDDVFYLLTQIANEARQARGDGVGSDDARMRQAIYQTRLDGIYRAAWDEQLKEAAIEMSGCRRKNDQAERRAEASHG